MPEDFPDAIDGLDIAAGVRRLDGDRELYLSMLRDFVATERNAAEVVATALASDDLATATRRAHTVKGLAGTFGALRLEPVASELETALREARPRAEIDAKLQVFGATLDALMAALDARLPPEAEPDPSPEGPLDAARLAAVCRQLLPLIVDCDLEACTRFDAEVPLLRAAFGDDFAPIARALHDFDFEIAEAALIGACRRRGYADPSA